MSKDEVLKKVQEIVSEYTGLPQESVTPNAELGTDLNIGSLDKIDIFVRFEDEFKIQFTDDDVYEDITIDDIVETILKKSL